MNNSLFYKKKRYCETNNKYLELIYDINDPVTIGFVTSFKKSIDKLKKGNVVTRAGAHLAAKRVEGDVKKVSSYGPQRPAAGKTGAYRMEEVQIDEKTLTSSETKKKEQSYH